MPKRYLMIGLVVLMSWPHLPLFAKDYDLVIKGGRVIGESSFRHSRS